MDENFIAAPTPHFHPGARLTAEQINLAIINRLAARRVRAGVKRGERAPAGAARRPMDLLEIKETLPPLTVDGDPVIVDITEPGSRTARIRLPAVLSRLTEVDPRRRAAEAFAVAVEKIGAIAGTSGGESVDGGAATNDGGVTTRLHHARTVTVAKAVADAHGLALVVRRADPLNPRQAISARGLMWLVCVEGRDLAGVLTDAGWSGQRRDVAHLTDALLACLEDLARAFGYVAADTPRPE